LTGSFRIVENGRFHLILSFFSGAPYSIQQGKEYRQAFVGRSHGFMLRDAGLSGDGSKHRDDRERWIFRFLWKTPIITVIME
jgi:hypothetical protein